MGKSKANFVRNLIAAIIRCHSTPQVLKPPAKKKNKKNITGIRVSRADLEEKLWKN